MITSTCSQRPSGVWPCILSRQKLTNGLHSLGVLLPKHWTPQPKDQNGKEKTVHLVQLDPIKDAQEYQSVQSRFQQTCANAIVTIQRVQNPALYGTYAIRKQKMDEAKGSNEKCLFHGTSGETCQLINHTGFNRSFRGKNGKG